MAEPKKVGRKWKHRVMVGGVRRAATFGTKAEALAWEIAQHDPSGPAASTKTCEDAFRRYEKDVSANKPGKKWEILRLAAFSRSSLGPVRMCDIDETHIVAWRDKRLESVSGSTVCREFNLLSNVFTFARKEWKWIKFSPTTDVSRPGESNPRFRRITDDEIAQMLIALDHREDAPKTKQQAVALAFLWAIETAMRAGEICRLTTADVAGRVAHVGRSKNGDERDVPLSPRAIEIWNLVPDGFGISSASLDALFRKARRKTTIEDMVFHDTRHEAITRLAGKLHVLDLARMTGHRDIKMLMRYYNKSAHDIAGTL